MATNCERQRRTVAEEPQVKQQDCERKQLKLQLQSRQNKLEVKLTLILLLLTGAVSLLLLMELISSQLSQASRSTSGIVVGAFADTPTHLTAGGQMQATNEYQQPTTGDNLNGVSGDQFAPSESGIKTSNNNNNLHEHDNQMMMKQQQQQQQRIAMGRHHHSMSCYACSTMDYDNSLDNPCRDMRKYMHLNKQQQQQPKLLNQHLTTTSLDDVNPRSSQEIGHQDHQVDSDSNNNNSSLTLSTPSSSTAATFDGDGDGNQDATSRKDSLKSQQLTQSPTKWPYHNVVPVRKRPCFEDENFCSIVSVVRLEFTNDTLITKFWAMERNCSKSCNTGCMLIGERVRLRVCSQCCRMPDCNVGSGSGLSLRPPIDEIKLFLIILILSLYSSHYFRKPLER